MLHGDPAARCQCAGVGGDRLILAAGLPPALVDALVGFAGAIGAVPIAEGAETPADLALLARTRGPLLVQGYALARPGPPWPAVAPGVLAPLASHRRSDVTPPERFATP